MHLPVHVSEAACALSDPVFEAPGSPAAHDDHPHDLAVRERLEERIAPRRHVFAVHREQHVPGLEPETVVEPVAFDASQFQEPFAPELRASRVEGRVERAHVLERASHRGPFEGHDELRILEERRGDGRGSARVRRVGGARGRRHPRWLGSERLTRPRQLFPDDRLEQGRIRAAGDIATVHEDRRRAGDPDRRREREVPVDARGLVSLPEAGFEFGQVESEPMRITPQVRRRERGLFEEQDLRVGRVGVLCPGTSRGLRGIPRMAMEGKRELTILDAHAPGLEPSDVSEDGLESPTVRRSEVDELRHDDDCIVRPGPRRITRREREAGRNGVLESIDALRATGRAVGGGGRHPRLEPHVQSLAPQPVTGDLELVKADRERRLEFLERQHVVADARDPILRVESSARGRRFLPVNDRAAGSAIVPARCEQTEQAEQKQVPRHASSSPTRPLDHHRVWSTILFGGHDMRLDEPRLPPLEPDAMPAEIRERFGDGPMLNIFRTLAHHPDLMKRWLVFGNHVLAKNSLSPRDREIAILRVGVICRAGYEFAQHVRIGLDCGITESEIEDIKEGPNAAGWSDAERAVLQATDELVEDAFVSDATWKALSTHYDTQQLIDLVFTVGQYNLVSMALNTLGVQLEEDGATISPGISPEISPE